MTRLFAVLPAWWFLQTGSFRNPFAEYSIGIAMVLLLAALWREDRKSRISAQKEVDKRYTALMEQHDKRYTTLLEQHGALVFQLKDIISGNTRAMTTLADNLMGRIANCPMVQDPVIGRWIRAFAEQSVEMAQRQLREGIKD